MPLPGLNFLRVREVEPHFPRASACSGQSDVDPEFSASMLPVLGISLATNLSGERLGPLISKRAR